jgi:hypothetical protein
MKNVAAHATEIGGHDRALTLSGLMSVSEGRHYVCCVLALGGSGIKYTIRQQIQMINPANGYLSATSAAIPKRHNVAIDRIHMALRTVGAIPWRGKAINQLPDQTNVGGIHQKEDSCLKRNRL